MLLDVCDAFAVSEVVVGCAGEGGGPFARVDERCHVAGSR